MVKSVLSLFWVEGVSEDVVGPTGNVCGMINFDQFLPLEEHRAAVVIVICDNDHLSVMEHEMLRCRRMNRTSCTCIGGGKTFR